MCNGLIDYRAGYGISTTRAGAGAGGGTLPTRRILLCRLCRLCPIGFIPL